MSEIDILLYDLSALHWSLLHPSNRNLPFNMSQLNEFLSQEIPAVDYSTHFPFESDNPLLELDRILNYLMDNTSLKSSPSNNSSRKSAINLGSDPAGEESSISVKSNQSVMSRNQNRNCGSCNQPVTGKAMQALGKLWHVDHFVCSSCKTSLAGKRFFEKDKVPYCDGCHGNMFAPKCAYCNQPVTSKCLNALDQSWHPEHFFCTSCKTPFDETSGFHEQNNKPYCENCYNSSFGSTCAGCNQLISDQFITALEKEWHPNCFVCQDCGKSFESGNFFESNGVPLCEMDYHSRMGTLCFFCQQPISGKCISVQERKFHPEHFKCFSCQQDLQNAFQENSNRPYCSNCVMPTSSF